VTTATTSSALDTMTRQTAMQKPASGATTVVDLQSASHITKINAYQAALAKLQPAWSQLPLSPYPPSGDNTTFPRTGSPALIVNASSLSQAQLNEPGLITQALYNQSIARRPKLNGAFVIGLGCLAAYFIVRR
jgi:hypothetical protein